MGSATNEDARPTAAAPPPPPPPAAFVFMYIYLTTFLTSGVVAVVAQCVAWLLLRFTARPLYVYTILTPPSLPCCATGEDWSAVACAQCALAAALRRDGGAALGGHARNPRNPSLVTPTMSHGGAAGRMTFKHHADSFYTLPRYRRLNASIVQTFWSVGVALIELNPWVVLKLYGKPQDWGMLPADANALIFPNHHGDTDWLFGWVLAHRSRRLGATKCIMKDTARWLPLFGWSIWFSEYLFLKRDWAADRQRLSEAFDALRSFPVPFWFVMFPEGTRINKDNLKSSQDFCRGKLASGAPPHRYPALKHVLLPKTKGFVAAVQAMRDFVPAVYSVTIASAAGIPDRGFPTMKQLLLVSTMHTVVKEAWLVLRFGRVLYPTYRGPLWGARGLVRAEKQRKSNWPPLMIHERIPLVVPNYNFLRIPLRRLGRRLHGAPPPRAGRRRGPA